MNHSTPLPSSPFPLRTPGPMDLRALDGNQKDIEPPHPPQHGECFLFKTTQTSCRRKPRCAEVRSVAAAPPRFLGPRFPTLRFPGERRDPGTTAHWMATTRTSNHPSLRRTETAFFLKKPVHHAD